MSNHGKKNDKLVTVKPLDYRDEADDSYFYTNETKLENTTANLMFQTEAIDLNTHESSAHKSGPIVFADDQKMDAMGSFDLRPLDQMS